MTLALPSLLRFPQRSPLLQGAGNSFDDPKTAAFFGRDDAPKPNLPSRERGVRKSLGSAEEGLHRPGAWFEAPEPVLGPRKEAGQISS
jgi:hypothetical protein